MIWMVIECYKYGMEQIEKTSGAPKKNIAVHCSCSVPGG